MKNKIIFLLIIVIAPHLISAENIMGAEYKDLDNDGAPDLAIIVEKNITAKVYDQDDDMKETGNLSTSCDFDSDVWVFYNGIDNRSKLIIDFDDTENLTAYIYDDIDNDGEVSYSLANGSLEIIEKFPRIKIVSRNNRWSANGKPDFSMEVYIDSAFGHGTENGGTDGKFDSFGEYYDRDKDGVVDLLISSNERNWFSEWENGIIHTGKVRDKFYNKQYLFWPLLGTFVDMDWENATIDRVYNLLPRFQEGVCQVWLKEDETMPEKYRNQPRYGWESPFAYYDLADDKDGIPELSIRMVDDYTVENKEERWAGRRFYEEILYTWDQNNDDSGDYRIYLIGKNEYDTIVEYMEFSVKHVNCESAPDWIYNRNWYGAIFAYDEDDDEGRLGEGIYENGMFTSILRHKFFTNPEIQLPKYIPQKVGDREEYTFNLNKTPVIYFSPIDNRMHLLNAEEGRYILSADKRDEPASDVASFTIPELYSGNASTNEKLEYYNTNNDSYLNEWVHFTNDAPDRYLIYEDNFLIYSDKEKTVLKNVKIRQSLFETLPPRNHEEWKELGGKLGDYKKEITATDFKAMYDKFSGDEIIKIDTILGDFKSTDRGFTFIFNCAQCNVESSTEIDYEKPLNDTDYVLEYNGSFSIKSIDLGISCPEEVFPGESLNITVYNNEGTIGPVLVQFSYENGSLIDEQKIPLMYSGENKTVSLPMSYSLWNHTVHAKAIVNGVKEIDMGNNVASIYVKKPPKPPFSIWDYPQYILLFLIVLILILYYLIRGRSSTR